MKSRNTWLLALVFWPLSWFGLFHKIPFLPNTQGRLFFDNWNYFDNQGIWGVQSLQGRLCWQKVNPCQLNVGLQLKKGQTLIDKWLFDWGKLPLHLKANLFLMNDKADINPLRLSLGKSLQASGRVSFSSKNQSLYVQKASLNIGHLAPYFNLFIKEPFKDSYPLLAQTLLKGRLKVKTYHLLLPKMQAQFQVLFKGQLDLPHSHFLNINLLLPVFYNLEGSAPGYVYIPKITIHKLTIRNLRLNFVSSQNQCRLQEPAIFYVQQGIARLEEFNLKLPLEAQGKLSLKNIVLPLERLQATILPSHIGFTLTTKGLKTQGTLRIKFCQGQVIVKNLSLIRPFSSDTKLKADIYFNDIDLETLSRLFNFGQIQGCIKGYIKHLVIAYGQPEGFDLLIESVKKKGVKQSISLKAVNNISILVQGHPIRLSGLLPKSYAYQKIGIQCCLKNDLLTIHGLVKKDHLEYLVKRWLWGINIVNRSPGQKIPFKEMMSRIKQIIKEEGKR